jgi:hypothetical protein
MWEPATTSGSRDFARRAAHRLTDLVQHVLLLSEVPAQQAGDILRALSLGQGDQRLVYRELVMLRLCAARQDHGIHPARHGVGGRSRARAVNRRERSPCRPPRRETHDRRV